MRELLMVQKVSGMHFTNYGVGRCEETAMKFFLHLTPDEFRSKKAIRTLNYIARTDPELSQWQAKGIARMNDARLSLEDQLIERLQRNSAFLIPAKLIAQELRDLCYQIYPTEHMRLSPETFNIEDLRVKWWKKANTSEERTVFNLPPILLEECGPCIHMLIPQINELIDRLKTDGKSGNPKGSKVSMEKLRMIEKVKGV